MNHLRLLGLLSLVAVAGCSQPSFLTSFADQPPTKERINPGTAPADRWEPAPDPVDDEVMPGTERISQLPSKVGECAETTITSITDRYGDDLSARAKKGADPRHHRQVLQFGRTGLAQAGEFHRQIPGLRQGQYVPGRGPQGMSEGPSRPGLPDDESEDQGDLEPRQRHQELRLSATGARFPKFVLHRSTHLSRTSESNGHQQTH
jgi:hypothetical protein